MSRRERDCSRLRTKEVPEAWCPPHMSPGERALDRADGRAMARAGQHPAEREARCPAAQGPWADRAGPLALTADLNFFSKMGWLPAQGASGGWSTGTPGTAHFLSHTQFLGSSAPSVMGATFPGQQRRHGTQSSAVALGGARAGAMGVGAWLQTPKPHGVPSHQGSPQR